MAPLDSKQRGNQITLPIRPALCFFFVLSFFRTKWGGGIPTYSFHSMKVSLKRSIPGIPGLDYRGVESRRMQEVNNKSESNPSKLECGEARACTGSAKCPDPVQLYKSLHGIWTFGASGTSTRLTTFKLW